MENEIKNSNENFADMDNLDMFGNPISPASKGEYHDDFRDRVDEDYGKNEPVLASDRMEIKNRREKDKLKKVIPILVAISFFGLALPYLHIQAKFMGVELQDTYTKGYENLYIILCAVFSLASVYAAWKEDSKLLKGFGSLIIIDIIRMFSKYFLGIGLGAGIVSATPMIGFYLLVGVYIAIAVCDFLLS